MTTAKKPNLFNYATSELSQDAFLCWLIAWADPSNKEFDRDLNTCAIKFVQKLIGKDIDIKSVVVNRQWHRIDVTALINNQYFILIENKTGTITHSDQLNRYSKIAKNLYKESDIEIIPIYFKMEEQGSYTKIDKAGFQRFTRIQMFEVLNSYFNNSTEHEQNDILTDFYKKLRWLDSAINGYENLPLNEWGWFQWQGFYTNLQNHINGEWGYVANASGGFLGFWWHQNHSQLDSKKFVFYLQLEQDKLICKLYVEEENRRREIRDFYRKTLFNVAAKQSKDLVRYGRLGKHMGIAKLASEYRITNENGTLDFTKTVENISEMMVFINDISQEISERHSV